MKQKTADTLKWIGLELLDGAREGVRQGIENQALIEKEIGIKNAITAMFEAGVPEETINNMIVKHWDLKPSDAKAFVDYYKPSSQE